MHGLVNSMQATTPIKIQYGLVNSMQATPNVALTLTKQTNSQFIDGSLVQPKRNHQTI